MGKKKRLQKSLTIPLTRGGHQQPGTCLRGYLSLCASVSLSHRLIYIQVRVHVYVTYVFFKIVLNIIVTLLFPVTVFLQGFPAGTETYHIHLNSCREFPPISGP